MGRKKEKGRICKRSVLTLEDKLVMIKRYEEGEKIAAIARSTGSPRSTVSGIVNDRERILNYVAEKSPSMKTSIISLRRGQIYDEMERMLSEWISRQSQEGISINQPHIQKKAKAVYEELLMKYPESRGQNFIASNGWFARFKRRCSLQNVTLPDHVPHYGAIPSEAHTVDTSALDAVLENDLNVNNNVAQHFSAMLQRTIQEGGYSCKQIFKVEETGLFWKRLPENSFIAQSEKVMPGYKVSKEWLTLLLGGNCSGDFKLKPLLVYHAANPRALKNTPKASLPVIWMNNINAWVTVEIFEEWFINHFIPAVKNYLREKKLPFKVLLLLDYAPGHLSNLSDFDPNVKVIFLPANTTSLLQPPESGVMALFKRLYLLSILRQAFDATCDIEGMNLYQFWDSYNIYKAILNISAAWAEVKQTCMNAVWKNLCPQYVSDSGAVARKIKELARDLVSISTDLKMSLDEGDFTSLIMAEKQPLSEQDLAALDDQNREEQDLPEPQSRRFTEADLQKGFCHLSKCLAAFEAQDPNAERFSRVMRSVDELFMPYRAILRDKKKSSKSHLPPEEKLFKMDECKGLTDSVADVLTPSYPPKVHITSCSFN